MTVTQTNPDGSFKIVEANSTAGLLVEALQPVDMDTFNPSTHQRWVTAYRYESSGRLASRIHSSAIAGYTPGSIEENFLSDEGLVEIFEYDYDYDDPMGPSQFGNYGLLTAKKLQHGWASPGYWIEKRTYLECPNSLSSYSVTM
jgi:hypothetical protein